MKLCECGCGKEVFKEENRFIHGHNFTYEIRSKFMKKLHKKWKKQNPESYKEHQSKAGKIGGKESYRLHKEQIIENVKKFHRENKEFDSKKLKNTRKKYPEIFRNASSKGGKNCHNNWKEKDIESYREHQKKASKKANEKMNANPKYRKIRSETTKRFHKENPDFFREIMRKTQNDWKKRDPIGYHKHHVKMGNISKAKNPGLLKENLLKAQKTIRENKPYIWKGVHFMSNEEMEVAKKILVNPKVNVNCHIIIDRKIIDFFPQKNDLQFQGCFVEYHPADWLGRSEEEYYNDRKEIIENSQYKGTTLIVLTDMENI